LGGPFAAFGQVTTPLTAAWFAWTILSGFALARAGAGESKPFGIVSIGAYALLMAALVGVTMM
jgi:hypothetical protein